MSPRNAARLQRNQLLDKCFELATRFFAFLVLAVLAGIIMSLIIITFVAHAFFIAETFFVAELIAEAPAPTPVYGA